MYWCHVGTDEGKAIGCGRKTRGGGSDETEAADTWPTQRWVQSSCGLAGLERGADNQVPGGGRQRKERRRQGDRRRGRRRCARRPGGAPANGSQWERALAGYRPAAVAAHRRQDIFTPAWRFSPADVLCSPRRPRPRRPCARSVLDTALSSALLRSPRARSFIRTTAQLQAGPLRPSARHYSFKRHHIPWLRCAQLPTFTPLIPSSTRYHISPRTTLFSPFTTSLSSPAPSAMHLLPHSLTLSCLLSLATQHALAAPSPASPLPRSIPLLRRSKSSRNQTEWLLAQKHHIESKYSTSAKQKRASGMNLCVLPLHLSLSRLSTAPALQSDEPERGLELLWFNSGGHARDLVQRHFGYRFSVRPFPPGPRHASHSRV